MRLVKITNRPKTFILYVGVDEEGYKEASEQFGKSASDYWNRQGKLIARHWVLTEPQAKVAGQIGGEVKAS